MATALVRRVEVGAPVREAHVSISTLSNGAITSIPLSTTSRTLSSASPLTATPAATSSTSTSISSFASTSASAEPALSDDDVRGIPASGWDETASGVVAAALLGLLIAFLALAAAKHHHRHRWKLGLKPARTWFPEVKAPLPRRGWLYWLLLPRGLPFRPPLATSTSDEQLYLRSLDTVTLTIASVGLIGLAAGFSILLASTDDIAAPSNLRKRAPTLIYGRYSALDDLTLIRLLRQPGHEIRYTVLTVLALTLSILSFLYLLSCIRGLVKLRRLFLASCSDLVWLPARNAKGLQGLSENRLWSFFARHELVAVAREGETTKEERPPIEIDRLSAVPDLRELRAIHEERERVLDRLEVAEAAYIASFEPTSRVEREMSEQSGSHLVGTRSTTRVRSLPSLYKEPPSRIAQDTLPPSVSSRERKSLVPPRGPQGAFQLAGEPSNAQSFPSRLRKLSNNLHDALGRTQPAGSFTELFDVHSDQDHRPPDDSLPIGNRVSINDLGQIIRQPRTPDPTQLFFDLPSRPASTSPEQKSTASPIATAKTKRTSRSLFTRSIAAPDSRAATPSPYATETFHPLLQPSGPDTRIGEAYAAVRAGRADLKRLNGAFVEAQAEALRAAKAGENVHGWLLRGKGARFLPGVEVIEARSADDVAWSELGGIKLGSFGYAVATLIISVLFAASVVPIVGLAMISFPGVADYLPFLRGATSYRGLARGLLTVVVPALLFILLFSLAVILLSFLSRYASSASHTARKRSAMASVAFLSIIACTLWLISWSGIAAASSFIDTTGPVGPAMAEGAISISTLYLAIACIAALALPMLFLLHPWRTWSNRRARKRAATPRRRFEALYPAELDYPLPSSFFLLTLYAAFAYALIAPLVVVPALIMAVALLVVQRYEVYYNALRRHSTGGLLALDLTRYALFAPPLMPFLLGLILLTRQAWARASLLLAVAALLTLIALVTLVQSTKEAPTVEMKQTLKKLRGIMQGHSLLETNEHEEADITYPSRRPTLSRSRTTSRRSWASLLDLLDSSSSRSMVDTEGASDMPRSEALDTYLHPVAAAARHPDAPPHLEDDLRPLDSTRHPLLAMAPEAAVWLPKDELSAEEAADGERYWGLRSLWKDSIGLDRLAPVKRFSK